ncbi:MAG: SOS response-associated peptidase [Lachnospiraceae bacterium]|nr:SOS response-associated peptidase [Lachnospiraceae bacterium]MBQ8947969.1 SOS response-associated peptidase [Lachnospiraceae bacterium]
MCCRYYIEMSPELKPYVDEARNSVLGKKMVITLGKPLKTEGEIFPTDMVPVIATSQNKKQTVFPMVWGFDVKGLDRPVVNARVETAKDKSSFKDSWLTRRCIIPASYYFEWEHFKRPDGKTKTGDKYAIQPRNSTITYLAGLYQLQEYRGLTYPVFTVLTREPSEELKKIHDRMPVVMPEEAIADWINPEIKAEDIISAALTEMVAEKA